MKIDFVKSLKIFRKSRNVHKILWNEYFKTSNFFEKISQKFKTFRNAFDDFANVRIIFGIVRKCKRKMFLRAQIQLRKCLAFNEKSNIVRHAYC